MSHFIKVFKRLVIGAEIFTPCSSLARFHCQACVHAGLQSGIAGHENNGGEYQDQGKYDIDHDSNSPDRKMTPYCEL
jgi:hypothetical protein